MKKLSYSNKVMMLRTESRLTQGQLAKEIGVCRRTISLIENNEQNVSLELAYRISAYFKLLIPDVFPPNKS
jgi:putative transcriptional regulator